MSAEILFQPAFFYASCQNAEDACKMRKLSYKM